MRTQHVALSGHGSRAREFRLKWLIITTKFGVKGAKNTSNVRAIVSRMLALARTDLTWFVDVPATAGQYIMRNADYGI